jgi:steroid delta-isomerase-like uncharacterized protein
MLKDNKAIARQFLDELWNQGDFETLDDLLASDYDGHSSTEINGPQGAKQFIPRVHSAFPDLHFEVQDQVAEGDKVATRWVMYGTHKGEFQGIPASGARLEMTGITIFRIANGKLIEGWTSEDTLGMMQQLGAVSITEQD